MANFSSNGNVGLNNQHLGGRAFFLVVAANDLPQGVTEVSSGGIFSTPGTNRD